MPKCKKVNMDAKSISGNNDVFGVTTNNETHKRMKHYSNGMKPPMAKE